MEQQAAVTADPDEHVALAVKDLRVHYATPTGDVIAVNGVHFYVYEGETIGLVGESGCGKTTCAMGILRLVQPPGRIVNGEVLLNGRDLIKLSDEELRRVRWRELALIPQGAMNSLNPTMRVKDQIGDAIADARRPAGAGRDEGAHPGAAERGGLARTHLYHVSARVERGHETARVHRHGHLRSTRP